MPLRNAKFGTAGPAPTDGEPTAFVLAGLAGLYDHQSLISILHQNQICKRSWTHLSVCI